MQFNNKVVWITGASSGIGEALAKEFAAKGAKLVLSARRKEKLAEVAKKLNAEALVLPIDMEQSENFTELAEKVKAHFGCIDVLVNNAGISQRSLAIDTPMENDRKIMEINFFGTVALTKAVLPIMKQQGSGHIVPISSVVGKFGFPFRTAYAASKHAMQGYFESLRTEVEPLGIKVSIVHPGRIKTQISYNALTASGGKHNKMDKGQKEGIPAAECASAITKAIANKKKELLVGGSEIWLARIRRFMPGLYYNIVTKKFREK